MEAVWFQYGFGIALIRFFAGLMDRTVACVKVFVCRRRKWRVWTHVDRCCMLHECPQGRAQHFEGQAIYWQTAL